MGVRTGAGRLGRVGARVRAAELSAPVSRRRRAQQSVVPRGAALQARRPGPFAPSLAPFVSYYACRVSRSLVLWCFMMVRHESARYADVPWATRCQTCHRHKWAGRRDASSAAQVSGPSHLASLVKDAAIWGSISCFLSTNTIKLLRF